MAVRGGKKVGDSSLSFTTQPKLFYHLLYEKPLQETWNMQPDRIYSGEETREERRGKGADVLFTGGELEQSRLWEWAQRHVSVQLWNKDTHLNSCCCSFAAGDPCQCRASVHASQRIAVLQSALPPLAFPMAWKGESPQRESWASVGAISLGWTQRTSHCGSRSNKHADGRHRGTYTLSLKSRSGQRDAGNRIRKEQKAAASAVS